MLYDIKNSSLNMNNVLEGFKFGGNNGMWLTESRKRNKFLATWSLSRNPSGKPGEQDVSGFVKISGKKARVKIYHDVDNNFKLNKKDELIGSGRGGKGFGYSNDFGLVEFKADAIGRPVNSSKKYDFSYYFNLIPSEPDSDVKILKIPVSSSFLDEQEFVARNNMSVSDFENMVVDTF